MTIDAAPLKLYKANLELQIRISRLVQEGGHRLLELASHASNGSLDEATAEIDGIRKVENWQSLATLPAEAFWRHFQQRVGDTQEFGQVAIKSQTAFTNGLREAIESWQKAVGEVTGNASSARQLQDIFRQWSSAWPLSGEQVQASPEKGA